MRENLASLPKIPKPGIRWSVAMVAPKPRKLLDQLRDALRLKQ